VVHFSEHFWILKVLFNVKLLTQNILGRIFLMNKFFNTNYISQKRAKLSLLINYFLRIRLLIYKIYYLISNKKSILSYP